MRTRFSRSIVMTVAALLVGPLAGAAQEPVVSMGQPGRWFPYAGASLSLNELSTETAVGGTVLIGVQRPLINPLTGGPTLALEGYLGGAGQPISGADGGFRAAMAIPIFFTQFGIDWNLRVDRAQFFASLIFPPHRGGLFGKGGQFRFDWIPARDQTLQLGVTFPVGQRWAGRTRPRHTEVRIPPPPKDLPDADRLADLDAAAAEILAGVRDYALRVGRWAFPISWQEGGSYEESLALTDSVYTRFAESLREGDALSPGGHSALGDRAVYLREMDRLFTAAAGDPALGPTIADSARAAVLDEVFLPYNRLMAQYKRPDGLDGFGQAARERFTAWVEGPAGLEQTSREAALAAYDGWYSALEAVQEWILERGRGDSRGTWLPLQLVLRPEQHDTRPEIDDLIERGLGARFTGGNAAVYISGQQFQFELTNQIRAAEDYHVLWIHDYRGRTPEGRTDLVGFHQSVNGYLRALTERVRGYDRTGRLPVYLLFFDQNYYEANGGRLFMNLLEDPLGARVDLPTSSADPAESPLAAMELAQTEELRAELEAWQDSLRAAVAGSARLQADASERGGADWIRSVVRVHVNITHPSDFSFRTSHLLGLPLAGDNLIRDHRKIGFRDVTERDPSIGTAMYTGVGVGEHYMSATWEDRALLVQGPALVRLKTAARELLLSNGFRPDEIPPPLRAEPFPADYEARVAALEAAGADARILQVQNSVGFQMKEATVLQMMLYDLMPSGTVIYVPDSIWTSFLWTGQLVGAAFRGCHVYISAPAAANAPSAAPMTLARTQELYAHTVVIQRVLRESIEEAGGRLRIGLYNRRAGITDVPALMREAAEGVKRYPFLREEYPLPDDFFEDWEVVADSLEAAGFEAPTYLLEEENRAPKLHRKTQFFASREAIAALARDPRVARRLRSDIRDASRSLATGVAVDPLVEDRRVEAEMPLLEAWADLPGELSEEAILYFTVGSLNKDWRGAALDGEALAAVSGPWALIGWIDFLYVGSRTVWLDELGAFE
ncbi:MAG: hypothetical protein M8840_04710, partial [marine benthic group bacterium]|nr:hypothetical protein [Gemmatimonadota bacterium]